MATDLGKAYIQIVPSAKGITSSIKDVIEKPLTESGAHGGSLLGGGIIKTLTKVLAVGSLGKIVGMSLTEGGKLQQSIGGVETLFGASANKLKKYASTAFRDSGVSANEYMEQATSFASALVQSCGGDTAQAVEIANMAIRNMSDNSNKFGTNIQDIQNAYQGFAKANYTMLDNLKLGYGGTKTEMQRLIKDASTYKDSQERLNVSVKDGDMSFGNIAKAIAVVQDHLKLTNTTQKEASTTLSGSFNMLKASWSDFLGSLSTGNNVINASKNMFSSLGIFLFNNLIPMIGNIGKSVITALTSAFNNAPQIMNVITKFSNSIIAQAPKMLHSGMQLMVNLASGIASGLPVIVSKGLNIIQNFANMLAKNAPSLVKSGFAMLNKLADGIITAIPILIAKVPTIITTLANIINDNAPTIMICGVKLIGKLALGLIQAIPVLIANIPKIIQAIVAVWGAFNWLNLGKSAVKGIGNGLKSMFGSLKTTGKGILNAVKNGVINLPSTLMNLGKSAMHGFGGAISGARGLARTAMLRVASAIETAVLRLPSKMLSIGSNIVKGIWNGIANMVGWITNKVGSFASGVVKKFKDAFGIHSPSRVMRDLVGVYIGQGIGVGIIKSLDSVKKDIDEFNDEVIDGFKPLNDAPVTFRAVHEVKTQMDNEHIQFNKNGSDGKYWANNGNVYQTVNVNSPQPLDPSEVARQTRNANRELILKLKGV